MFLIEWKGFLFEQFIDSKSLRIQQNNIRSSLTYPCQI